MVSVPIAYSGRRLAGAGRRLAGHPRDAIDHDIHLRTAQHLFEVLGELRGGAAKLGQIAGIFLSAIPERWADPNGNDFAQFAGAALTKLQDSVPPMLPGLVHQVLADNLGSDWRADFREFSDQPAAAASLGQVHRAVWRDGRPVAVKLMYPGARKAVQADLRLLRGLAGVFGALLPGADMAAIIEMVCACVDGELDYRREAAHQQMFAEAFAGDPEFAVPAVVAHTDDVIVGDWLSGVPAGRLLTGPDSPERSRAGLRVLRFAHQGHRRCGLLYSDIHPGNFLLLPDGRLGVVDFGACGVFPDGFGQVLFDIGDALYNGTPETMTTALRTHGFVGPDRDCDAAALLRIGAPIADVLLHQSFRLSPKWLRRQVRAIAAMRLTNVFRQMTLPPELTVVARAVITGAGTMCLLHAEGPIRDEFLSWWPELAQVVHRYEQRPAPPQPYPHAVEG
ncbi:MAG: AarF/ABC1/UbiB kinase family protein [Mycobacteriaceae bacterium]|nr:AarF/ABC1/UbiB kinase family protein [Mycobacteriaceae bacterium]